MLQISQFRGIVLLCSCKLTELVEVVLCGLMLVDDYSIVEVTTLDKSSHEQGFYLTHEDKGASCCHLGGKLIHIVECGKLATENLAVEGYHAGDGEILVGQEGDASTCGIVAKLHLLADIIEVLGSFLLLNAHTLDGLHI